MKIGIVSDVHCQHRALDMALERMGPVDRLVCAGDCIDQSRFCNDTVARLRDTGALAILGNHDLHCLAGEARRSPRVDPVLADWLADRPRELRLELGGLRIRVVHATSWPSDFAYVPPGHAHFQRFEDDDVDVLIYGHTHMPVVKRLGRTLVINPGSVGEGRPEPRGFVRSCAVLDTACGEARIVDLD
ncbi:metallophosphoesterase family protein [Novosphingobium sp. BL-52-GroH]|uniref:metallophosphoesterase family protein n=1 Tax=Novosphingobium sp. BL-52-GroH TaxID=3349877 RepID=UPI003850D5DC